MGNGGSSAESDSESLKSDRSLTPPLNFSNGAVPSLLSCQSDLSSTIMAVVVVAAAAYVSRHATIVISNQTKNYCLINPKVHLVSGQTFNPPQPTVRPLKTEVCTFRKTSGCATGSVGVLTYDLFKQNRNNTETLAIMFSVPYDYNLYRNWFAVGIYPKGKDCDYRLFEEMYYQDQQGFVRAEGNWSGITFKGKCLDIRATMCPLGGAIIRLEVWDKIVSPMSQQVC